MISDLIGKESDGIRVRDCVGCGYCCAKTPCDASRRLYPSADHCPQLLWMGEDKRYKCGLMLISGPVGAGYREELYAGAGCCSGLNSWRNDVKKRDRLDKDNYWNPLDPICQTFIRSLATQFMSSDIIELAVMGMETTLRDNYSQKEIKKIQSTIVKMFTENRHSFMEGFMP